MIHSDLEADCDKCKHCGRLLYEHYGGKRERELLREWDGDAVFAIMVEITCAYCGGRNEIFYAADMLPPVSAPRPGRWAWAAAV